MTTSFDSNGNHMHFTVPTTYLYESKPKIYASPNTYNVMKPAVFVLMVTPEGDVVMVTGQANLAELAMQDFYTQTWMEEYPYYSSKDPIISKPTLKTSYQLVLTGIENFQSTKGWGAIVHLQQKNDKYSAPNPALGLSLVLIDKVKAKMPQHLHSDPEVNEAIKSAVLEMFGL